MTLTRDDKKYWEPSSEVVDWVCSKIPKKAKVLEVGPGHVPFPRAQKFVDIKELPNVSRETLHVCDLAVEPLPFKDKSFDFIYCRHVLEDMYDPFWLCDEMSRVGKAGYVEVPSPIAEMCRGIDGGAPPFRGYHHHRFIGWVTHETLNFVSKFPVIEHLMAEEAKIGEALKKGPKYWNTYYFWSNSIKYRHFQCPADFDIMAQYGNLLSAAMAVSQKSSDEFWQKMTGSKEESNGH
jgi:hypothetical protein